MKKTFSLTAVAKDDARVRDKIRHEINKYVRRARQKPLPEGFTVWNFECRAGASDSAAETRPLKEIGHVLDTLAETGATEAYVEIVPTPGQRAAR